MTAPQTGMYGFFGSADLAETVVDDVTHLRRGQHLADLRQRRHVGRDAAHPLRAVALRAGELHEVCAPAATSGSTVPEGAVVVAPLPTVTVFAE